MRQFIKSTVIICLLLAAWRRNSARHLPSSVSAPSWGDEPKPYTILRRRRAAADGGGGRLRTVAEGGCGRWRRPAAGGGRLRWRTVAPGATQHAARRPCGRPACTRFLGRELIPTIWMGLIGMRVQR